MQITEMHYEFKLQNNKIDANDRVDFKPWEIDQLLNRAILYVIQDRYDIKKAVRKGFETSQRLITDLANLHIKSPELQPAVVPVSLGNGRYELNLNALGNDIDGKYFRYLFLTKAVLKITKNNCSKLCSVNLHQIDDNKNTYNEPSWQWNRTLANFGKSTYTNLYAGVNNGENDPDYLELILNPITGRYENDNLQSIYFDTTNDKGVSQFNIEEAYISYIKYPNRVFFGGYNIIDTYSNDEDPQIHCDLDDSVHHEIVRQAVFFAYADLQDQLGAQISAKLIEQDTN